MIGSEGPTIKKLMNSGMLSGVLAECLRLMYPTLDFHVYHTVDIGDGVGIGISIAAAPEHKMNEAIVVTSFMTYTDRSLLSVLKHLENDQETIFKLRAMS